jgi:hypothetical protein
VNGTGDSPFDDGDWLKRRQRWTRDYGSVSMFPRVPSIEPGDRLIEYAAGSARYFGEGRLFAVSEAVSEPEPSPHERWPVQVRTRTLVAGPRLEYCPSVNDIGVLMRSLGRHSHIRLREEQGSEAEELIAAAAREFGSLGASCS